MIKFRLPGNSGFLPNSRFLPFEPGKGPRRPNPFNAALRKKGPEGDKARRLFKGDVRRERSRRSLLGSGRHDGGPNN